ncbi:MAG: hypothetical protein PWQ60_1857 [Thermoanaerobacteraceae bacterium]|nr:hypothetical protein [Thermoanaerobacteraceae bacterium]
MEKIAILSNEYDGGWENDMDLKGVIFDLDGTLLDSLPVCYSCFRNTLKHYVDRDFSDSEIRAMFGPSEEGIFKKLLPDSWEDCLRFYLEQYDKAHSEYDRPFPGIKDALELLRERKVRLAIVSGKGPKSMEISLRHSGLGKFFEVVVTGSEHGANKIYDINQVLKRWGLSPDSVAYVGDMAYDISAAKEAGVFAIAAAWAGTAEFEKLKAMKPSLICPDVETLIEWIKEGGNL